VYGMLCSSCGDDGKICCLKDQCLLYSAPDGKKNNTALHRCNTCTYFNVHKRCMKLYAAREPQTQSNAEEDYICIVCRNSQPKNFFHPLNQVRIDSTTTYTTRANPLTRIFKRTKQKRAQSRPLSSNVHTRKRPYVGENSNKTTTVSSPSNNTGSEDRLIHLAETATTVNTQKDTGLDNANINQCYIESETNAGMVSERLASNTGYANEKLPGNNKATTCRNDTDVPPRPDLLNTEGSSSSDENDNKTDIVSDTDNANNTKAKYSANTKSVEENTLSTDTKDKTKNDDIDNNS